MGCAKRYYNDCLDSMLAVAQAVLRDCTRQMSFDRVQARSALEMPGLRWGRRIAFAATGGPCRTSPLVWLYS